MNKHQAARVLSVVGRALFPNRTDWKSLLADALGVSSQTVRNWERGHSDMSRTPGVMADLEMLCASAEIRSRMAREYIHREKNLQKLDKVS